MAVGVASPGRQLLAAVAFLIGWAVSTYINWLPMLLALGLRDTPLVVIGVVVTVGVSALPVLITVLLARRPTEPSWPNVPGDRDPRRARGLTLAGQAVFLLFGLGAFVTTGLYAVYAIGMVVDDALTGVYYGLLAAWTLASPLLLVRTVDSPGRRR